MATEHVVEIRPLDASVSSYEILHCVISHKIVLPFFDVCYSIEVLTVELLDCVTTHH